MRYVVWLISLILLESASSKFFLIKTEDKLNTTGGEDGEEGEDGADGDKFFLIETEDTLNKTGVDEGWEGGEDETNSDSDLNCNYSVDGVCKDGVGGENGTIGDNNLFEESSFDGSGEFEEISGNDY